MGRYSDWSDVGNFEPDELTALRSGNYRVKITNWSGETYSDVITVTVNAAPALQPPNERTTRNKGQSDAELEAEGQAQKNAKYTLPATTSQGEALNWKVSGAGGCKIKAGKLSCSKSTGKKAIKLVATASATATLNAFAASFKAKVG